MVKAAGLDPARDFRGADLRGVDFTGAQLGRYDFSGADLRGAVGLPRENTRAIPPKLEGARLRDADQRFIVLRGFERSDNSGDDYPLTVQFDREGRRLVSDDGKNGIILWGGDTGTELQRLTGHGSWVSSVAFSPDGRRIVSGSEDGTLRIWDAESGATLAAADGACGQFGA